MKDVDVVVVGAGPVGLLTAIELKLGGVDVLVLERLASANTASKALGIGPLGSEALRRRGLAEAMGAAETRSFAAMKTFLEQNGSDLNARKFAGHFGGLSLIRRDVQSEPDRRAQLVDQQAAELMLADRACELGIELRRGCDVTHVAQDADGGRGGMDHCERRRSPPLHVPRRVRRGTQPRPQDGGLRVSRHGSHHDDVHGRRHDRPSRPAEAPRVATHAGRRVILRAVSRPPGHAGLQRAARGSTGAGHAGGDRNRPPPRQRPGRERHRAREREPVDRQHASRRHLPLRPGAARRRCGACPFAVRGPGHEPRPRRRRQPWLEARRGPARRDAGRLARHVHRRAAPRPPKRFSPTRSPRPPSCGPTRRLERCGTSWRASCSSTTSTGSSAR